MSPRSLQDRATIRHIEQGIVRYAMIRALHRYRQVKVKLRTRGAEGKAGSVRTWSSCSPARIPSAAAPSPSPSSPSWPRHWKHVHHVPRNGRDECRATAPRRHAPSGPGEDGRRPGRAARRLPSVHHPVDSAHSEPFQERRTATLASLHGYAAADRDSGLRDGGTLPPPGSARSGFVRRRRRASRMACGIMVPPRSYDARTAGTALAAGPVSAVDVVPRDPAMRAARDCLVRVLPARSSGKASDSAIRPPLSARCRASPASFRPGDRSASAGATDVQFTQKHYKIERVAPVARCRILPGTNTQSATRPSPPQTSSTGSNSAVNAARTRSGSGVSISWRSFNITSLSAALPSWHCTVHRTDKPEALHHALARDSASCNLAMAERPASRERAAPRKRWTKPCFTVPLAGQDRNSHRDAWRTIGLLRHLVSSVILRQSEISGRA